MTDKVRFHCRPEHIGLFARLYREHLYGATIEAFEMTLRDIARRCRVRASTVEDWITGEKIPTGQQIQTLIDIAVEEGFIDKLAAVFQWLKQGGLRLVFRRLYGTRDGDFLAGLCSLRGKRKVVKVKAGGNLAGTEEEPGGTHAPNQRGSRGTE